MAIVVQKYGGTSVGSATKIKSIAKRIISCFEKGNRVVAVVSAMGDTTDDLITLAKEITPTPDERELDVLLSTGEIVSSTLMAMAIRSAGYKAVSLSGAQAGIYTDNTHNKARILRIDPERVKKELDKGNIVIVAGFQGINEDMDITTLGRGGSDTTAVAIAVALKADSCEIYTDVEGVYTADPRVVPDARKLKTIGYEEMLEMATYGAKVMHSRAVELGQLYNIPILVASSFSDAEGTIICGGSDMERRNKVSGIAYDTNVAKITVLGLTDKPGIAASIFEPLAKANINIDTIVQNASVGGITDLTFTVARNDLDKAMDIVKPIAKSIKARDCVGNNSLAKLSIIGTGMQDSHDYER